MLFDPETWVALAFVVFVAGLGYIGAHRMIAKSLDERAGRIKAELDEARKLKDDAAQLLAEYRHKREQAESEAQEIIAGAKAEAERLAVEAKIKIEEFVARRTKLAEVKIAQAEAQAAAVNRGGQPRLENPKEAIKLRLDRDLLAHFRATGRGWQTRINDTLRKAARLKRAGGGR